ncbi:MAG: phage head spike fiber domain-containing protein [Aeromonadaceae bacterium]
MPYQLTGILKLPDGTPAANVDIEFISQANYSPLVRDLSNTIRTGETGSYSVELEYGEYAIRLLYASAYPLHPGKIYVYADTPTGQDLPTLMQAANWTPTTPDYIVQIQNWLIEAKASHDGSMASAAEAKASELAAKASEIAVEADRAEVAANKASVSASQADVTTKQADVAAKAAQVASDKAAVEAAKTAAVSASNSASESASNSSGSASAAATSAANSESSALRAEAAAGSLVVEEIPFPDVWIPFSDSLAMLAGYGDEIKVGSYVVARMASFSRASGATYIDKSGKLVTAAINEPRFEKEGLLIEGQSTNQVVNSLFTSDWSQVRSAIEQNATTSPDGTNNAIKLRCDSTANTSHRTGPSVTYTPGTTYTASVFVKPAELNQISFRFFDTGFGSSLSVMFTLDGNGSVNTPAGTSGSITKLTNGWYRISASREATVAVTGGAITFDLVKNDSMNFDGDGVSGVYLYGGQIEALPFATSYIPTNGAAATRAADFVSIPEAGNDCVEWYSGGTPITPTKEGGRIKFSGQAHYRNIRGFMTALTAAQKASIR